MNLKSIHTLAMWVVPSAIVLVGVGCNGRPLLWKTLVGDDSDDYWRSPLLVAAKDGDLPKVQHLLAKRVPPDEPRSSWGNTALEKAVEYRHYDVIQALMDAGADPDIKGRQGSPIDCAALYGDLRAFDLLKTRSHALKGAPRTDSLIHQACLAQRYVKEEDLVQILNTLLKEGCDPNLPDSDGQIPLQMASRRERELMIRTLLDAGADPYLARTGELNSEEIVKEGLAQHQKSLAIYEEGLNKPGSTIMKPQDASAAVASEMKGVQRCERILGLFKGHRRMILDAATEQH